MKVVFTALLFCINLVAASQNRNDAKWIKEQFAFADSQYRFMMKTVPPERMPHSYNEATKELVNMNIEGWTSGFYPATLWLIYEQTKDSVILGEAKRALELIRPNQFFTNHHDLGFMMHCSFGNAYRLTGDSSYKNIILNSARSLATRYRPGIQSIQSWNKNQYFNCPVIVDNMMNLEILMWASRNGASAALASIAVNHSNTTMKEHYRKDHSAFHVVDYDTATGKILKKSTHQGAADCSSWSRGQAWGLYGFTLMYRYTKNPLYLLHAENIAMFLLRHPHLPKDKIPYWDFDAPLIPLAKRDASAAAIMASALLELGQYSKKHKAEFVSTAHIILKNLSGTGYRSGLGENGGFILKHSVGNLPAGREVDVPLVYADYYFLEGLKRWKDWYGR